MELAPAPVTGGDETDGAGLEILKIPGLCRRGGAPAQAARALMSAMGLAEPGGAADICDGACRRKAKGTGEFGGDAGRS